MATGIDDEFLVVRLNGNLDRAALLRVARELRAIEPGRLVAKRIVLIEEIATASITADEITCKMGGPEPAMPVQTAFVVSTDFQYGIARMFQSVLETEKNRIEIFRDLESAGQWLQSDLLLLRGYPGAPNPAREKVFNASQRI